MIKHCVADTEECASDPCETGWNCIEDEPGRYTCVCPIGYEGEYCEKGTLRKQPCRPTNLQISDFSIPSHLQVVKVMLEIEIDMIHVVTV